MSTSLLALIIAALAGVTMALQGSLNAVLGKVTGLLEATFLVHLIGLVVVSALLIARLGSGDLHQVTRAPWYTLLGGALGVAIVYGVVTAIPRVGVANATTAIIAGQLITAMLIDHFGLFGLQPVAFNWWKMAGILIMTLGGYLMLDTAR